MTLSEIKLALSAYDPRHLQIFSHLLQYFEGENVPPGIIRQVISSVISEEIRHRGRIKIRSRVNPEEPISPIELKPCPNCGRLTIGEPIQVEELLISVCDLCRWSTIVEVE